MAKAAAAFLTVVVYSRVLGAHFRGELSLMLLYLQLALMINEMVVGSVMANWFVRFDFKFLTQRLWWVSGTVLGVFGLLGWLGFNWGYMVLPLVLLGATLVRQNMVINLLQSKDLISLRNRWQFHYEALKLILQLVGFGLLYFLIYWANVQKDLHPSSSQWAENLLISSLGNSEWNPVLYVLWILAIAGIIWWWLSRKVVRNVLNGDSSHSLHPPKSQSNSVQSLHPPKSQSNSVHSLLPTESQSNSVHSLHPRESQSNSVHSLHPPKQKFGWREIKEGFLAQLGHLVLFLIYRMPIFMCSAWMLEIWGFNREIIPMGYVGFNDFNRTAGILSNVLLIADTLWIFANSLGGIVHAKLLQPDMMLRSVSSQNRWIWRFFIISILGTSILTFLTALMPDILYTSIFGREFGVMAKYFSWIIPGVLALGVSAVIGHVLHARNQFSTLLKNHAMGLGGMLLCWWILRKPLWPSDLDFAKYLLFGFNFGLILVMVMNFLSMGPDFRKRIKTPRNILITLNLLLRFVRNRTH